MKSGQVLPSYFSDSPLAHPYSAGIYLTAFLSLTESILPSILSAWNVFLLLCQVDLYSCLNIGLKFGLSSVALLAFPVISHIPPALWSCWSTWSYYMCLNLGPICTFTEGRVLVFFLSSSIFLQGLACGRHSINIWWMDAELFNSPLVSKLAFSQTALFKRNSKTQTQSHNQLKQLCVHREHNFFYLLLFGSEFHFCKNNY